MYFIDKVVFFPCYCTYGPYRAKLFARIKTAKLRHHSA